MHQSLQDAVNQRRMTRNIPNDERVAQSYERKQLKVLSRDFSNVTELNVTQADTQQMLS